MAQLKNAPDVDAQHSQPNDYKQHFLAVEKAFDLHDIPTVLLPLCALLLWFFALPEVNLRAMNDLGLVSVMPPALIVGVTLVTLSFCLALSRPRLRTPIILLHLGILIFMLFGVTAMVEQMPRFSVVYRHAGYTEFIMRTGSVDPHLDAYFSWPGFFILSAFVTNSIGYHDILGYAAWAPVFNNLLYLAPLYVIFNAFTLDRRLIWLSIWFFYLTNWIAQDYFSPQGLNFFLYLVILAILLRWFKLPVDERAMPLQRGREGRGGPVWAFKDWLSEWFHAPDRLQISATRAQQVCLLGIIICIFGFIVFSHPLTPFFVITSVTALVIFRRCWPFWLPLLMVAMNAAWIFFMTQTFLAGHSNMVTGDFGLVRSTLAANIADRVIGDPQHTFIEQIRLTATLFLWSLALIGAFYRLRFGYRDLTLVVLALAPFPIIIAQSYGGEMLLRIYLFSLPFMCFFAASIFFTVPALGRSLWTSAVIASVCLLMLGSFLFTRYGNENTDYITYDEYAGIHHLYDIAPRGALLIKGWDMTPWQFTNYEKYDYASLSDDLYYETKEEDVDDLVYYIREKEGSEGFAYIVITRSDKVQVNASSSLEPGSLDRFEQKLLSSDDFRLVYSNPDAQIFQYIPTRGDAP